MKKVARAAKNREYAPPEKTVDTQSASRSDDVAPGFFRAGIIGAGETCRKLIQAVIEGRLDSFHVEIAGVADKNPRAPGLQVAEKLGLFTSNDYHQLYFLPGITLLIELTGSDQVLEDLARTAPRGVSILEKWRLKDLLSPSSAKGEADIKQLEFQGISEPILDLRTDKIFEEK